MSERDLSVIVPVYRSQGTLAQLHARLRNTLDPLGLDYEIILVEDGSPDGTWQAVRALQAADPEHVTAIELMRNFGQHNALMCGFRHARGRVLVTIDDDLQHPPEEIPKLLEALQAGGCDLAYGVPRRKRHALWRNRGSAMVGLFYRLVFGLEVQIASFRALRRELADSILSYSLNYTFVDGLLAWNTRRIAQVTVEHCPRAEGRSGYSLGKLLVLALNLFTNFSLLPLEVVSLVGMTASALGLAAGIYYLILYLTERIVVPGYASTIIAILVLGGLQLLALGIMGEYLGRLHLNVNRKPQYTVRQLLRCHGEPQAKASPDDGRHQ